MDAREVTMHYKRKGDRVDEVLHDIVLNHVNRLEQENKRLHEALESIGSKGYVSEGNEYADVIANECIAHARRALKGEQHGPSTD